MGQIKKSNVIIFFCIILLLIMFRPKSIFKITGKINEKNIPMSSNLHLRIMHKHHILEGGTIVESDSIESINVLLNSLKKYKCIRIPIHNRKKFDNKEMYYITISNSSEDILNMCTLGDEYIQMKSNYGFYGPYKIVNGKLDLMFLEEFTKSLDEQ